MRKSLLFILTIATLTGCSKNKDSYQSKMEIALYESYNLIELSNSFFEANKAIQKYLLDSISEVKTGIVLLDDMNQDAISNTVNSQSIEYNPLFEVFAPNTILGSDGINHIDTSAVLGTTTDSIRLFKYLNIATNCFPEDITWKISDNTVNNFNSLHAIKTGSLPIILGEMDIDSVYVMPLGFYNNAKGFRKVSDLQGITRFMIEIKLKDELADFLTLKTYSLFFIIGSSEYSSSVNSFNNHPNQHIVIGEVNDDQFNILKETFEQRMKVE